MTTDKSIDILSRTIYGEARGESLKGMEAIASVVLNRVIFSQKKGKYWWGNDVVEVCKKPWQFSCWNENDPNSGLVKRVDEKDEIFCICKRIASRAINGMLEDATNGATHYHTKKITPAWSIGKIPCASIGSHVFYNDIE